LQVIATNDARLVPAAGLLYTSDGFNHLMPNPLHLVVGGIETYSAGKVQQEIKAH